MKTILSFALLVSLVLCIVKGKKLAKDRKSPWGINDNDKKVFLIALAIFMASFILIGSTSDKKSETTSNSNGMSNSSKTNNNLIFTEVSSSEYARDSEKCIAYRVYINSTDFTEEDLLTAYNTFIEEKDDGYYLHTVMVYSSKEIADGSEAWDVANLEELVKGDEPKITFLQESQNSLIISIDGESVGDYGVEYTMNADNEFAETVIMYEVPSGKYKVINNGENANQINVYSDDTRITDEGTEEFASTESVDLVNSGESVEINVPEGYHVDVTPNSNFTLEKIN